MHDFLLTDGQVNCLEEPAIGWNPIAHIQHDYIAGHELARQK